MIERLIPKYPTFLMLGFIVVASGLFILTAGRDAVIVVWANKFFDGKTDEGLFEASQIADHRHLRRSASDDHRRKHGGHRGGCICQPWQTIRNQVIRSTSNLNS